MSDVEGYKEDAQTIPDPGLDAARMKDFSFDGAPSAANGVDPIHPVTLTLEGTDKLGQNNDDYGHSGGDSVPLNVPGAMPGEPDHARDQVTLHIGENDFPRQTGHDSLNDDAVPFT